MFLVFSYTLIRFQADIHALPACLLLVLGELYLATVRFRRAMLPVWGRHFADHAIWLQHDAYYLQQIRVHDDAV